MTVESPTTTYDFADGVPNFTDVTPAVLVNLEPVVVNCVSFAAAERSTEKITDLASGVGLPGLTIMANLPFPLKVTDQEPIPATPRRG